MKHSVYALLASTFLVFPAYAQDTTLRPTLKPRVEGNIRAGTERTIAMTEIWVPLAQDNVAGSVIYGDGRIMGDDDDNKEFNLGVGYRKIVTDVPVLGKGVAGVNAWFDRRLTERGSTFHQITAGAEWHGEEFDIKANAYIPLSDDKTHSSGTGATAPYLAGSGIFYDINNMSITEEPQPGIDLELGFNVSGIIDGFTDSTRLYGGVYHFAGDKSENISGWRARIASDITEDVQVGARFQRDDERGSQGFLEATIRFPFGNKQSYRQHGLCARLDESPERDIDIVTGTTRPVASGVVQTGVPVLNATSGAAQRVLYVDNTAAGGGTGTLDNPFNTLASAQAALADNDVVYVAHGDGTTTNMAGGFTVNRSGVSLIGEGSAFVFDGGKFTAGGADFSGTVLKAAGFAPVITNANVGGDGILITANNALISGFTINNAQREGIRAAANGVAHNAITIDNVTVNNAGQRGVLVTTLGGGSYQNVVVNNVRTAATGYDGVRVLADTGSINSVVMSNISATGAGAADSEFGRGVILYTNNNGNIVSSEIYNVTSNANISEGVYIVVQGGGDLGNVSLRNITANNNQGGGVSIRTNHASSVITSVVAENIQANNNTSATLPGIGVLVRSSLGEITNTVLRNVTATGNAQHGIMFHAAGGARQTASLENSIASGNAQHGVVVYDDTSGTFEIDLGGGGRSAGRNVLAANTLEDLALEYDGRTIAAMNNWWGQASGPDQDAPNIGIRPQIYYGAPSHSGLIAHYTFDDQWMSGTTAYDRTGNSSNGTVIGGATTMTGPNGGQSLVLDGVDDRVSITLAGLNLAANAKTTVVFNANWDGTVGANGQMPFAFQNYDLWHNATGAYGFNTFNTNVYGIAAGVSNAWVQNAAIFNNGAITSNSLYLNGTAQTLSQQAGTNTSRTVTAAASIGSCVVACGGGSSYYFDGQIDDVRIYNRALTAAEISELNRMSINSVVNFGGFMTSAP